MLIKDMSAGSAIKMKGLCTKAEIIACSNGKNALFTTITTRDDSFTVKQWDVGNNVQPDKYINKVVEIDGTVTSYKGVNEVKAFALTPTEDDVAPYVKSLDYDALCKEFIDFLKGHLSENYYSALKVVFNAINFEKFVTGYAATSHHDNVSGGLINHTLKMLKIAEVVINNIAPKLDFMKDRIYTGIVVHDIGKTLCYTSVGGVDTLNYVSHNALGVAMLGGVKEEITQHITEDEYYQLLAIIIGHHDEFGEPCHSVATQIIYYIDMLESQSTGLVQLMEQVNFEGEIKFNGKYLHI